MRERVRTDLIGLIGPFRYVVARCEKRTTRDQTHLTAGTLLQAVTACTGGGSEPIGRLGATRKRVSAQPKHAEQYPLGCAPTQVYTSIGDDQGEQARGTAQLQPQSHSLVRRTGGIGHRFATGEEKLAALDRLPFCALDSVAALFVG